MSTPLSRRSLVSSILSFLRQSLTDGSVKSEDVEGLEVAIQCIGEAFGVDAAGAGDAEGKELGKAWEASTLLLRTNAMSDPSPSIEASCCLPIGKLDFSNCERSPHHHGFARTTFLDEVVSMHNVTCHDAPLPLCPL
ncbi:hypothetical protein BT69DRAFT_1289903 [Atractiella rhizophila]|nr:hypothetical protein BT69DRAFT_1289903 [Atractiella rhizophila]